MPRQDRWPRPRQPGATVTPLRARPSALERLEQVCDNQLVYRLPKPEADGSSPLGLTPLQLIERLAGLILLPRWNAITTTKWWQRYATQRQVSGFEVELPIVAKWPN